MKKLLLILFFIPTILYCQYSTTYKEFNAGIYLGEDILVFPGASFLWGTTIYYHNNTLLDYEIGLAFPTLATAKLGFGIGNDNNSAIIGLRPWPTSFYFQYTFKEKRLFSIEFMPPYTGNDWSPNADWPIILNYGYRW